MSLASGDLTTLADAQAYLGATIPASVLSPMITRLSRSLQSYLNRGLLIPHTYLQQFNGQGTRSLVLPEYPLLQLDSLTISGVSTSIAPQVGSDVTPTNPVGYRFQPWDGVPPGNPAVLELVGGSVYLPGNQNIVAGYRAGYQVSGEVPTSASYTPTQPYGRWATDEGVIYASTGVTLVPGTGTTSPSVGVYIPPTPESSPVVNNYLFNSTDVGTGLLIAYGYIPGDLEQVILEIITSRNVFRLNPGIMSQSLAAQESISFGNPSASRTGSGLGFGNYVDALMPYKSVLPPAMGANV
jgi:hypothetical protein